MTQYSTHGSLKLYPNIPAFILYSKLLIISQGVDAAVNVGVYLQTIRGRNSTIGFLMYPMMTTSLQISREWANLYNYPSISIHHLLLLLQPALLLLTLAIKTNWKLDHWDPLNQMRHYTMQKQGMQTAVALVLACKCMFVHVTLCLLPIHIQDHICRIVCVISTLIPIHRWQ